MIMNEGDEGLDGDVLAQTQGVRTWIIYTLFLHEIPACIDPSYYARYLRHMQHLV